MSAMPAGSRDSKNVERRSFAVPLGSARGRPKIPDGTKRDGYVRVMGKWVWAGPKQPRKTSIDRKRRVRIDRTILVQVYCPKLPSVRGDEEHTRTINLHSYADRDWLTFMQDNYTQLGGERPTLFPSLNNQSSERGH